MTNRKVMVVACALALAGACGDPTPGGGVSAGEEALDRCDIRAAHAAYSEAYTSAPDDPDAALGFALTDMLLVGEDPNAVAGLQLWGFTGGMDSEMLLWGPSALLDTLTRHGSGSDYGDFVEANFPYPPVRDRTNGLDRIAADTTARQVVERGFAMQERFARISAAFETAAQGAPRSVSINGSCGVGTVELQAAELYLLAGAWQGVVLGLQIARGYSWDFLLLDGIDWRDGSPERLRHQADVLNEHLGAVSDAGALSAVPDQWRRFFSLMNSALRAADAAGAPGPDALVEWRAYRAGLLPSMLVQGEAAQQLADGTVTAPGLTPEWSGELQPLFRGELDLAAFGRSFEVYEDPMWGDAWIEVDEAPIDQVLMAVLSRSPFDDTLSNVEWSHLDDWSGDRTDWQIVEVPSERADVYPIDMPRFISPTVERYRDQWYFE